MYAVRTIFDESIDSILITSSTVNVMVLNTSSHILNCAHGFKLGRLEIVPLKNYCYLGIQSSLKVNGSFKQAIEEFRKKALRFLSSIRRIMNTQAPAQCPS